MKQEILTNTRNKKVFVTNFDSIRELVAHNKTALVNQWIFGSRQASITGGESFTGTASYEQAEMLLTGGWDEGAKKLTSTLKIENAKTSKDVNRAIFDIVGFQCSVPRYLQGVPQSMINKKTVKQKQKVITLYKSIAYSAAVSKEKILDDSVKFLQIVQEIEKQGIRVNAYVIWHSVTGQEEALFRIKIKSSSERLNISKMSFPLMHPSMLRRMMFRALETDLRLSNKEFGSGYGRPGQKGDTQPLMKDNEYLIPALISVEDAKRIVEGSVHNK